ncbi:MAG: hypothetical protein WD766_12095 [Gemmatimonadota bacterium]
MLRNNLAAKTTLAILLSTFAVACGGAEDTDARAALERESLERELELALQPDSTQQVELNDVPLELQEETPAPPVSAPAPTPRPTPRPTPPQPAPQRQASPAPTPAPAPAPAPARPRVVSYPVPAGTSFGVRLNERLSTADNPVGSTFTATLTDPILAPDGSLLIPAGATVRGRVTESRESGRAGQEASLGIEFTSITYGGRTHAISGTAVNTPVRLVTRDSRAEQAAKIGGGAAIGAVLGRVIGRNTRSTVAGAAVGAAAGTAVAMGSAEVDAVVDEGANVTIRMERGITIDREG